MNEEQMEEHFGNWDQGSLPLACAVIYKSFLEMTGGRNDLDPGVMLCDGSRRSSRRTRSL